MRKDEFLINLAEFIFRELGANLRKLLLAKISSNKVKSKKKIGLNWVVFIEAFYSLLLDFHKVVPADYSSLSTSIYSKQSLEKATRHIHYYTLSASTKVL